MGSAAGAEHGCGVVFCFVCVRFGGRRLDRGCLFVDEGLVRARL